MELKSGTRVRRFPQHSLPAVHLINVTENRLKNQNPQAKPPVPKYFFTASDRDRGPRCALEGGVARKRLSSSIPFGA
jgi:hypothetical protein